MTVIERFLNKIKINKNECWIWQGAKTGNRSYAAFHYIHNTQRYSRAHRIAWLLFIGEIPIGLNVLHKCDVRLCVNPNHLFLGTQSDNLIDCVLKGESSRQKLTKEQVIAIRSQTNLGCRKLAKIYQVDRSTIMEIRRRDTWRNI